MPEQVSLAALRQCVEQKPDSAKAHLKLGTALLQNGIAGEAEKELNKALELDATCAGAWVNLGGLYLARWDFAGSIEANIKAIECDPNLELAHFNLGLGYLYSNQPEKMLPCFQTALELKPDHAAAHYYVAVGLLATGDALGAGQELTRATELGHTPEPEFIRALDRATKGMAAIEFDPMSSLGKKNRQPQHKE